MKSKTPPEGTLGLTRVMEELHRLDENMPVIQALVFLYVASRMGTSQPPMVSEIATALNATESRISRNLILLEEAGYLQKMRDPSNSRVRLVSVTDAGFNFLTKLTSLVTTH